MKLTKEIKLENTKRCDGCPELDLAMCNLGYIPKEFEVDKQGIICKVKRPKSCIKENGA